MRVNAVMDYLDNHFPFFKTLVVNIGTPIMDTTIATAMVRARRDKPDEFEFAINPEFMDRFGVSQQAAIFAHEALHILFKHLAEIDDPYFTDNQKRIIAQECIINDFVVDEGFDLPMNIGLITGPDRVGLNTASYTTKEVYDLIPDDENQVSDQDCDHFSLSEDQAKELAKKMMQAAKANSSQAGQQLQDAIDNKTTPKAGTSGAEENRFAKKNGSQLEWIKLLKKLDPRLLDGYTINGGRKTSWHEPPRKTAYMYPDVLLPTYTNTVKGRGGRQKPEIVLALDQSGSIPRALADTMRALAMSIPDTINVRCCTFSTFYRPFDHKSSNNQIATGGTSFSAVEDFARESNKRYPKTVLVITDGEANFAYGSSPSTEQLMNNWYWLMTPGSNQPYCTYNAQHVYQLQDFVKEDVSAYSYY